MKTALLVLALSGCANVHVNRAALIASTLALACDWGQTNQAATHAEMWPGNYETNPVLGGRPSPEAVDAYFVGAIAVNAALWLAMPARYRSAVPIAVTAMQAVQVRNNMPQTSLCGW